VLETLFMKEYINNINPNSIRECYRSSRAAVATRFGGPGQNGVVINVLNIKEKGNIIKILKN